ncbi:hypothetical protein MOO45_00985 [Bombilactobacillus folatiphilus]|uniref:Ppx/GppA phosphatase N-terminal domain-containing protein n=1 Tax=Bombilactobacillus folatiphilus TaxID=2923362 RepID=A0ABY4P9T3_9LACO|nr:hypothetical protein [Bombilactobacillus folatiphilus]UQS82299.1 hypothetical protein MOO45_00985 [Bombilactobacillus folatiphilus]
MTKIALIDVGSNSIRMAIYQIQNQQIIAEGQRYREFVQLAKGMTSDGCINDANFDAGVQALKQFRQVIDQNQVDQVIATATEAIRRANNQKAFLAAVQAQAQIKIQVLSGYQEAYFDSLAIQKAFPTDDFLFLDMGGGSFELGAVINQRLVKADSWSYGAVTLYDLLRQPDCLSRHQQQQLQKLLQPCWSEFKGLTASKLVVIGGVHQVLFEVMQLKANCWQPAQTITRWVERVQHNNLAANSALANMEFVRAPFMPAGLMPLREILTQFAIQQVSFCSYALRDGILADLLKNKM